MAAASVCIIDQPLQHVGARRFTGVLPADDVNDLLASTGMAELVMVSRALNTSLLASFRLQIQ